MITLCTSVGIAYRDDSKAADKENWNWTSHCLASNEQECWEASGPTKIRLSTMCRLHDDAGGVEYGKCDRLHYTCPIEIADNGIVYYGMGFYKKPAPDGLCREEKIWSKAEQKWELC